MISRKSCLCHCPLPWGRGRDTSLSHQATGELLQGNHPAGLTCVNVKRVSGAKGREVDAQGPLRNTVIQLDLRELGVRVPVSWQEDNPIKKVWVKWAPDSPGLDGVTSDSHEDSHCLGQGSWPEVPCREVSRNPTKCPTEAGQPLSCHIQKEPRPGSTCIILADLALSSGSQPKRPKPQQASGGGGGDSRRGFPCSFRT